MLEITFQNKLEDIRAWAHYMAKETEEGKKIGKLNNRYKQFRLITFIIIVSQFAWGISDSILTGVFFVLGGLFMGELSLLLATGFDPIYASAYEVYISQEKQLTDNEKKMFAVPRKIEANEEYIETSSPIGFRRCKWVCVDKIGITSNFIFIHIGGCPTTYIPKRDFPSEQAFKEFGEKLMALKHDFDSNNRDFVI